MLLVIAGRPGSGKTTLAKGLLEKHSDWKYVEAVTTRQQRASDLPGQYEHITEEEFNAREERGDLILAVAVHGYKSAIKKISAHELSDSNTNGLIVLVPSFVSQFLELSPHSIPVYILSDEETLRARLLERGDDPSEVEKKLLESRTWDAEAKLSNIPYAFLQNISTKEEMLHNLEKLNKPADLNLLKPKVKEFAEKLMVECKKAGFEIMISRGFRTKEEQDEFYAQGRTRSGEIITLVKGGYSFHNHGVAFDIRPVVGGGEEEKKKELYQRAGKIGMSLGLEWGGTWKKLVDLPHFQYPAGYTIDDFLNSTIDESRFSI